MICFHTFIKARLSCPCPIGEWQFSGHINLPMILSFDLIFEFSVITQLNERNDTLTAELSDVKVKKTEC